MRSSSILLALATAAAAIDIRFINKKKCDTSASIACNGAGPHACCNSRSSTGFPSVFIAAIPSNWDVFSKAYRGETCNNGDLVQQFRSEGRTSTCHGSAGDSERYRSAEYFFPGKKVRGMTAARDVAPEDCVPADTLYFADETAYAISNISDEKVEELVRSTLSLIKC